MELGKRTALLHSDTVLMTVQVHCTVMSRGAVNRLFFYRYNQLEKVCNLIFTHHRFLNKVTSEILRQGIFSDKGIRKALDSCLALNKQTSSVISGLEKENLLYQLKQELGSMRFGG